MLDTSLTKGLWQMDPILTTTGAAASIDSLQTSVTNLIMVRLQTAGPNRDQSINYNQGLDSIILAEGKGLLPYS